MPENKAKKPLQEIEAGKETSPDRAKKEDKASTSRRALIKAGLIGAPLILTLKARPGWAQDQITNASLSSMCPSGDPNLFNN
jgi:hypothetical protein